MAADSSTPKGWRPSSRYDHGFAIVRFSIDRPTFDPINDASVVRVLWSLEAAMAEAARLNRLNGGKGYVYVCNPTRVERRSATSPTTGGETDAC